MIQMWLIASRYVVVSHRSRQLDRLEEFIGTPAGEDRNPVGRGLDVVGGVGDDSLGVPFNTMAFRRTWCPGSGESFEFPVQIGHSFGCAPVLIRLSIQVDTQNRKRAGLEGLKPREVLSYGVRKMSGDRR